MEAQFETHESHKTSKQKFDAALQDVEFQDDNFSGKDKIISESDQCGEEMSERNDAKEVIATALQDEKNSGNDEDATGKSVTKDDQRSHGNDADSDSDSESDKSDEEISKQDEDISDESDIDEKNFYNEVHKQIPTTYAIASVRDLMLLMPLRMVKLKMLFIYNYFL